jgi:hypothetical protein
LHKSISYAPIDSFDGREDVLFRGTILLLPVTFVVYLFLALLIDARALPRGSVLTRNAFAWAFSLVALTLLYAFWFVLSWRPIFANNASLITLTLLVLISNVKYRDVYEPLNVPDFALIPQIWRHPRLYQAEFLHRTPFWLVVGATIAITIAWCIYVEPALLPAKHRVALTLGGIVFVAAILACIVVGPLPSSFVDAVSRRMLPVDSARHVAEFGLAGSLLAGMIAWRRSTTPSRRAWSHPVPCTQHPPPVIVVLQCESFVDLARSGVRDVKLPGLARAREQSFSHGRMIVPVQGAWTLRCEFAFLTGQPLSAFGFDALHPYLRLRNPPHTLAHHMRDIGFHTVFMHPFDIKFFNRGRAMPILGFDRVMGSEAFADVEPDGFYIGDLTVAERILNLAAEESRPLFCFAVTMENHNPWSAQRLPNLRTPADKYIYHLLNSDRMITRLFEELERLGRPVVFAFYGDHVPTLPSLAHPFPDTSTDYFVAIFQDGVWFKGGSRDLVLHELADLSLDALSKLRPALRDA